MNPFEEMLNDSVFLVKASGRRLGPYKTALSSEGAQIFDGNLDVDEGDCLVRPLPNGKVDSYTVLEAHFNQRFGGIPAHFDLKLKKSTFMTTPVPLPRNTTIHISNSSGVQVGDNNILNIQNAFNDLIQRVDDSGGSPSDKQEAKSRISALLAHPLVASILGGVSGGLTGMLNGS